MREKFLGSSYIAVLVGLFFYAFTQIDLGLAFSKSVELQKILFSFQQIGYFQRPLSTALFLVIVILLFGFYLYFLWGVFKNKIKIKFIWLIIGTTAVILAFSYNAFSYDLFNYIFDTKIVTHYHQNPYLHKALDFPKDPMLAFMHWTHRTYPYGPLWLGLTIPLSFLGAQIFWLTFFIFKFFIAGCYLGSAYLIYLINKKILPEYQNFNLVLFALNPLVIIESLVSSHNDIVMILFALFGIYLFLTGRKLFSIIFIAVSAAIKIPTISLVVPLVLSYLPIKSKLDNQKLIWAFVLFSTASLFYVLTKLEIQPWYILWVFPFTCLLRPNKYLIAGFIGLTAGLLLRYAPFLYYGNWDGIVPNIKLAVTLITPVVFVSFAFLFSKKRYGKNN